MAEERSLDVGTLLNRLTEASPSWLIWKNVDSALSGAGDVDSVAPQREWPSAVEVFTAWAADAGLRPVIVCRHLPGALFLVACDQAAKRLVELDVYSHLVLRGRAYVAPEELASLTQIDPRGFRRLRPGAEGLFLLLASTASDKRLRELLDSDPGGASQAAALFGRFSRAALLCADATVRDRRNRWAMTRWKLGALAGVARAPRLACSRLFFGLGRGSGCPVIAALAAGRRIPPEATTWLADVRRTHPIV
ncbi:MAG: hypothetical protein WKF41_11440 [Gaiellaceae bacterium]